MAGTLTIALRAAQSGLMTTQAAIDASANNIANVNSEGYSRKEVHTEQRILAGAGAGVQLSALTRAVDEGLLKDLRRERSDTEKLNVQTSYFDRIEATFGTPADNTSISHLVNNLNQAAESLALTPNGTIEQAEFVRWADEIGYKLRDMTDEIQALRLAADQQISDTVDQVNLLATEIASLNDKIIRNGATSHNVTDLEDRRDIAINELSKLMDISYYHRGDGDVVIFATDGFTVVDGSATTFTHTSSASVDVKTTYAEGDITGIYAGGAISENDITTRITGGALAGLIAQRDSTLPELQAQLDELASDLRDAINQIHNRGTSFPGAQSLTGTRSFIDPSDQQIQLDPTSSADDVAITLFDVSGNQQATTTLDTIMTSGAYGTGAKTSHGTWSISEVAQSIQDWLQDNGAANASVSVNSSGKFTLELSSTSLYLGFRDQASSTQGASHEDAAIGYDSDGDGDIDETISGFSNFLGLNDFYEDTTNPDTFDSATLSSTWGASAATLTFYSSTNGVLVANKLGDVSVSAGDTLSTIKTSINDADIGVTASVIPDGTGYRLRVIHDSGEEMIITQAATDTLLTDMAFAKSESGAATNLGVRSNIRTTPSQTASGAMQWDADKNEYFVSRADNTSIKELAEMLQSENNFETAGGLAALRATFTGYAGSILGKNASDAASNAQRLETNQQLVDSLTLKAETFSGVNLDEEMSNLIIFQQAYSASARVISVIQTLFEKLDQVIR